jgi:hypothetical protein
MRQGRVAHFSMPVAVIPAQSGIHLDLHAEQKLDWPASLL